MRAAKSLRSGLVVLLTIAAPVIGSYRLTPDSQMVYEVEITGDTPQGTQTLSGLFTYDIKSVDPNGDQASVRFEPALRQKMSMNPESAPGPQGGMFMQRMPIASYNNLMSRNIVINQRGRVIESDGEDELPFVLGDAWQLAIEPAPPEGQSQWQIERPVELERRMKQSRFGRMGMDSAASRTAEEYEEYKPTRGATDGLTFDKYYQLVADEKSNGQPVLSESGDGQVRFDQSGWVKSEEMHLTLVTNQNHIAVTIPVTIKLTLLDAQQAKAAEATRAAEAAAAAKAEEERNRPRFMNNYAIDDALAKLKSVDTFRIQEGCREFEHAIVDKARQTEVASTLEGLLKSSDGFVRMESAKALAVWEERANLPALESALQTGDVFLKHEAISAIARFPSHKTADIIAAQLPDMQMRIRAEEALIKMGPVAEDSVIPYLKNPDLFVRDSACKVLAAIGTTRSIPALEDLSGSDHTGLAGMDADRAVEAIRARMK